MDYTFNKTITKEKVLQHAYALELLEDKLHNGARALDVGSGSGYLTVCMALMMGKNGLAVGIEHIPELKATAEENIRQDHANLLRDGRVELVGKSKNLLLNNLYNCLDMSEPYDYSV